MAKERWIKGNKGWKVLNPDRKKTPGEKATEKAAALEQENLELKDRLAALEATVAKLARLAKKAPAKKKGKK